MHYEMVIQGKTDDPSQFTPWNIKQVDAGVQATSMQTTLWCKPSLDTFRNLYLAKMKNDLKCLHRIACADEVV